MAIIDLASRYWADAYIISIRLCVKGFYVNQNKKWAKPSRELNAIWMGSFISAPRILFVWFSAPRYIQERPATNWCLEPSIRVLLSRNRRSPFIQLCSIFCKLFTGGGWAMAFHFNFPLSGQPLALWWYLAAFVLSKCIGGKSWPHKIGRKLNWNRKKRME